jgi:hypothetical protein
MLEFMPMYVHTLPSSVTLRLVSVVASCILTFCIISESTPLSLSMTHHQSFESAEMNGARTNRFTEFSRYIGSRSQTVRPHWIFAARLATQ